MIRVYGAGRLTVISVEATLLYYPQMKSLKLDHELAQEVLKGNRRSTWRLYDDKDLSVNDEVELIDKVNPSNPSSWVIIGRMRINSIVHKRLGDISQADLEGHETLSSSESLLEQYQQYYGPQVSQETPVKIVHFSFEKQSKVPGKDVENTSEVKEVKLYADGGSRGNPGPSASGFALMDMSGNIILKQGVYLGVTTNNQAEYRALKLGLEEALREGVQQIHVFMDSLLVVNQMLGTFKVKNRDLWPTHQAIKDLVSKFRHVSFTHIPRELNKIADSAVNEALDKELEQS